MIASYFALEPFLAFTKQAVGGDVLKVTVEPSEKVYSKPVVLIISGSSYSAAETLPLADAAFASDAIRSQYRWVVLGTPQNAAKWLVVQSVQ